MENNAFAIRPLTKPAFHIVQPEQSHPRLSLRRVLYVKFLRWVEKSSASALMKAALKCLTLLALLLAITVPHFALGMLTAATRSPMAFRVGIYCVALLLTLNAKRLFLLARPMFARKERSGNQHTYHGVPLDEFATYLFDKKAFATVAMNDLGLSQRKWAKVAEELEANGILTRGENNSRVLADIDRETLVRQLRDGFPLAYDAETKAWVEKRGQFDWWVLRRERAEAKRKAEKEKLDRQNDRLRANIKKLREEQSAFQSVMALTHA